MAEEGTTASAYYSASEVVGEFMTMGDDWGKIQVILRDAGTGQEWSDFIIELNEDSTPVLMFTFNEPKL